MWTPEQREKYKDSGERYPSDLTDEQWESLFDHDNFHLHEIPGTLSVFICGFISSVSAHPDSRKNGTTDEHR